MTSQQIVLLAAALAAFLVGWLARSIKASRESREAQRQLKAELEEVNEQLEATRAEQARAGEDLRITRAALAKQERHTRDFRDQARTLSGNLKSSERRVAELEAQVQASEEQFMRVQRELARQKLYKSHEIRQLQQQLRDTSPELAAAATKPVDRASVQASRVNARAASQGPAPSAQRQAIPGGVPLVAPLPDISSEDLDTEEDVFEMTSEFDFDPEELLADVDPE